MAIYLNWCMEMDNLRRFCVRHNYYTRGDVRAYDRLLTTLREDVDNAPSEAHRDQALLVLAEDIVSHSTMSEGIDPSSYDWDAMVDEVILLLVHENVLWQFVDRVKERIPGKQS